MTAFVIDASTALSWCFEDESVAATDELIDIVAAEGAIAPGIWPLEVGNGLMVAERRRRIKPADSAAFIAMIDLLPIAIDASTAARALHETLILARDNKLSVYDAAYLELAMRTGKPLATRDQALGRAARRVGVSSP